MVLSKLLYSIDQRKGGKVMIQRLLNLMFKLELWMQKKSSHGYRLYDI